MEGGCAVVVEAEWVGEAAWGVVVDVIPGNAAAVGDGHGLDGSGRWVWRSGSTCCIAVGVSSSRVDARCFLTFFFSCFVCVCVFAFCFGLGFGL